VLIYPAVDLSNLDRESMQLYGEGFGVTRDDAAWFLHCYLPAGTDPRNPLISPLLAESHEGLPPAHLVAAGHDILRDEGGLYRDKLRQAGVPVTETCRDNQIHGFLNYDGVMDAAHDAFEDIAAHLRIFFDK
jgi:acetyl esterase